MQRVNRVGQSFPFLCSLFLVAVLAGSVSCSREKKTPEQRYDAAKTLFDQITKEFHIASAEAKGADKARLQKEAASGYERLLKKFPEQEYWAAQALRNLAGVRAAQGKLDEAVKLYDSVGTKYPKQSWEVLQAWKAAGDLLWENGRKDEAKGYYQKLVNEFDKPDTTQVVKTVVRGSKRRLAGEELPGAGESK